MTLKPSLPFWCGQNRLDLICLCVTAVWLGMGWYPRTCNAKSRPAPWCRQTDTHTHTHTHIHTHTPLQFTLKNPTQNLHHLPPKFAFLCASHTQGVPLTFPHFPRLPHPHPTLPADCSLAWNWKLVGTGFVVGNKASCTQASRWLYPSLPTPTHERPQQEKAQLWEVDVGIGGPKKESFRGGQGHESRQLPSSLSKATGTANWQRDRTALPPHRIPSIHRKRPKPEK